MTGAPLLSSAAQAPPPRFVAEPTNGCGAPFTIGTLMQSSARLAVTIGAQPGESTVSPVDTSPRR